ncbi:MAG: hypothetical protein JXB23_15740 [Candidatus Aminicenantes bacterium]|nr:hypothetical protein [Candidatus Aminicenantes bacterium]
MNRDRWIILILGFIVLLSTRPTQILSQETDSQLYLMGDFLVDVSRAAEYEAAVKEIMADLEKHGFPFSVYVYTTDDGHYYAIYPMKNYDDADLWSKGWGELAQKMGIKNLQAIHDRIVDAEIERRYAFWRLRPDISFLPKKERLKPEEIGYYTWDFVWVIPGKEAEFEAVNKEWIALSTAKKARDPFLTYMGDLGTKSPVYVWFEYGKSAADYSAAEENFWKAMGEEGAALSKRTRALIRRMESKTGRYRPDLSYSPESK